MLILHHVFMFKYVSNLPTFFKPSIVPRVQWCHVFYNPALSPFSKKYGAKALLGVWTNIIYSYRFHEYPFWFVSEFSFIIEISLENSKITNKWKYKVFLESLKYEKKRQNLQYCPKKCFCLLNIPSNFVLCSFKLTTWRLKHYRFK